MELCARLFFDKLNRVEVRVASKESFRIT
jgi:hypothetical protein